MREILSKYKTFDQFKKSVINTANGSIDLLMKPLPSQLTNRKVRTEKGLISTFNLLVKSAENYYYNLPARGGVDPVEAMTNVFSITPGMGNVRNVSTVNAMDITISSLIKSFIPYIAIERGMDAPQTTIYYRDLVALRTAGGVNEGDVVLGNFSAPNTNVQLGQELKTVVINATSSAQTNVNVSFNSPLVAGSVIVKSINKLTGDPNINKENYVAGDFKKDGIAYGTIGNGGLERTPRITINYDTGIVNISNISANCEIQVSAKLDHTSDETGGNTLEATTVWRNSLLVSENVRLVLKESIEELTFINKIQAQIRQAGAKIDYFTLGLRDLTTLYIQYIDRTLTKLIVNSKGSQVNASLDISSYTTSSFAPTKDDFFNKFIIDLNQQLLSTTGIGTTFYLVGSRVANIMMNIKDRFKPLPSANDSLNDVIGTYDGIPVLRHQYVDIYDQSNFGAGVGSIYAGFKDPNNEVGSIVFGEFLPMYVSGTALNYNNPAQFSRALFSQIGFKLIENSLIVRGEVRF